MTKDFANRGQSAKKSCPKKPRSSRATPTRNKKSASFHGPSFSSGAIFDIIVLLAAYLPEWINTEPKSTAKINSASENAKVTFEFQIY